MQPIVGDLFSSQADVILITTNGVIKRSGELVMGAGAAKQLALRDPRLPRIFGQRLRTGRYRQVAPGVYRYGLLIEGTVGAFQTKLHWKAPSSLELIAEAARMLADEARRTRFTYAVNFPGIGLGGLEPERVLEVLEPRWRDLPIEVWRRQLLSFAGT